ncbi:MAG: nitroreductase family protein [Deltaproteobacteria bacterium]|jgi:nitroreductase|nr:nitroreductase family protein [Deltaproteobacteria bacterium]
MTGDVPGGPEQFRLLAGIMAQRRSVRVFEDRPVAASDISALLKAFDSAPQAGGDRGRRCLMITDPARISELAAAGKQGYQKWLARTESPLIRSELEQYGANFFWFERAPLLAVSAVRRPPAFLQETFGQEAELFWGGHLSAAMAMEALLLAAEALGLGACCLGGPMIVRAELEGLLGLGRREQISLLAAAGYPKGPEKNLEGE